MRRDFPSSLTALIFPLWSSTIALAIDKPIPEPPVAEFLSSSNLWNSLQKAPYSHHPSHPHNSDNSHTFLSFFWTLQYSLHISAHLPALPRQYFQASSLSPLYSDPTRQKKPRLIRGFLCPVLWSVIFPPHWYGFLFIQFTHVLQFPWKFPFIFRQHLKKLVCSFHSFKIILKQHNPHNGHKHYKCRAHGHQYKFLS